jgi:Protein of unknown function (DUF1036)
MSTKTLGFGRRRMASLAMAGACACMLLGSLLAVNAHAATKDIGVSPNAPTGALHLNTPVTRALTPKAGATPQSSHSARVAPWGTAVYFRNNYGRTIWVATERYNPGCYGSWENQGWYRVEPGQSVHAFTTSNEYAYYYAQAADGAVWSGNYAGTVDPYYAYDFCTTGNTNQQSRGMRSIDLGGSAPWEWYTTYTVNLNP